MKVEVNGQVFDSVEDYENNYVVSNMGGEETRRWYQKRNESEQNKKDSHSGSQRQFTDEETRLYLKSALKSVFVVFAVFGVGIMGFIAFCVFIWFK